MSASVEQERVQRLADNAAHEEPAYVAAGGVAQYLRFGDLRVGARFIALPLPGDDAGHGGFLKAHFIFQKVNVVQDACGFEVNAVRCRDGVVSHMPDVMRVIEVE